MMWLAFGVAVAIAVTALVAYAWGKYWLGLTRFRGHLATINWSAYFGIPDWYHWGLAWAVWLDADKGMHFSSTGVMVRIGPFTAGFQGVDSN